MIEQLNLNLLRIFSAVYRAKSMTTAARELHLTQSGVSQHIRSLEETLGVKLFDRMKQKIIPTDKAKVLYSKWQAASNELLSGINEVRESDHKLSGVVSIGFPSQFGNGVVLPLLIEFGKKYPDIRFDLAIGFAAEMNQLLLDGFLDFAFVDSYAMDKRIITEKVYDETIELWVAKDHLKKVSNTKNQKSFFEELEYIDYEKGEPILRLWLKHHLGSSQTRLKTRAHVSSAESVLKFIRSGLGAGILPGHLSDGLRKDKNMQLIEGSGKTLKNEISLAFLSSKTHSLASQRLIEFLKKSLKST